jgi:hypothetical protein
MVAGLVLITVLVVAACGSAASSSSPTPSTTPSTSSSSTSSSAADKVKADWQAFFAGTTPAQTKITLLQNGQAFSKTIQTQAASPIAKGTQAQVTAVKVVSPTKATVTYSILVNGQPALTGQTGVAVLEGGTWKVGKASFQALLAMEQQAGGASPSPSPTK